jgi:predicted transposase YdaD
MPQTADLGGKRLVSLAPSAWVKWVTGRDDVVAEEVLSEEYQWVGRVDDAVIRAYSPDLGHFLVALEIQLHPLERMPRRVFAYAGLAADKGGLPVYPVVIHLLEPEGKPHIPERYHVEFLGLCHRVDYKVINLWEVDSGLAFRQRMRSLLPLVPLMRGGRTRDRVLQAREALRVDEDLSQMEPLLAFFASYFLGRDFVSEMEGWRMDLIVESPLFKELMRQAEERGAEKAAREAAREAALAEARRSLVATLEARFGAVPKAMADRIGSLSDLEALHALVPHAATAASLQEFEKALPA